MNITLDSSNPADGATCKVGQPCQTGRLGQPSGQSRSQSGTSAVLSLRQRTVDGLNVPPESQFLALCDETGITAAAHFDGKR